MSASPNAVMNETQAATTAAMKQAQANPGPDPAQILAQKEQAIQPQQQAVSAAEQDLVSTPQPGHANLPQKPDGPLVDPNQYSKFSAALVAMAMIAGSKSRGNWLGVSSSLNGALKGYLEGNEAKAKEAWKKYQADYDKAIEQHKEQEEDYSQTIENKKLSINQKLQELQWKAAKYDDQYTLALAKQKRIDELFKTTFGMADKRATLDLQRRNIDSQISARASLMGAGGAADKGSIGMVLSGAPLNTVVPGYGKQASAQRQAAKEAAIKELASDLGVDEETAGMELAKRQVEYSAGKVSTAQLTKMVGATRQAVSQLDFNTDKVSEEMKKLPSSDISPVLNALARGEEKWSGDPAYSGLFYYMNAAATESARLLSGGQASAAQLHQGAAEEAKQWANINMTPASWEEVKQAMRQEGQARLKTYEDAIRAGETNFTPPGKPAATAPSAPTTPAIGTVENGYKFKGGDPAQPSSWERM